ncbi:hypothetical protein [Glycomyces xiaoerkulensis]|uniref:hypothetical protein n=1 Tax=Glycomyces xiaoerkulensis TaxID=2038139 RepID=UPI0012FFD62E|nr:hypothetical protein [Glycomyces xiaoerkulensis]
MTQQLETASTEASSDDPSDGRSSVEAPADPASPWASVSTVHYSVTHTDDSDTAAWIDCDSVVHTD